jgi:hypothetical protein
MLFVLQIAYADGTVVQFPAGGKIELDLRKAIVDRVATKKIGIGHTAKQVEDAVRESVNEVMDDFKRLSIQVVHG